MSRLIPRGRDLAGRIERRIFRSRAELAAAQEELAGARRDLAEARAELERARGELEDERARHTELRDLIGTREVAFGWQPGHFYSPIPDLAEVRRREARIFDRGNVPAAVDLREDAQRALLRELAPLYRRLPWSDHPGNGLLYGYHNEYYHHCDGVLLGCLLQHLRPRRYLEVGSGWSTALVIDARDHLLDGELEITCVEPHPERLRELIGGYAGPLTVIAEPFEEVDLAIVHRLGAGDILFVDSSHVVKVGGDVNRLLLDALPRLAPGVWVHVHDVFWPFEYPAAWVYGGRAWTEQYLLRAFLAYNGAFEITLFNEMIFERERDWLEAHMPIALVTPPMGFWMRRRA